MMCQRMSLWGATGWSSVHEVFVIVAVTSSGIVDGRANAAVDVSAAAVTAAAARIESRRPMLLVVADDLDEPAPVALAIQLDEEDTLPGAELKLALAHRDRLTGSAEQHRHAVRVAVPLLHVLGADVLGAPVEVVVGVVALARDKPAEKLGEVLEETGLELVHPYAARRVRRVDARDAVDDAALANDLEHLIGDVADGKAAGRPEPRLALEDFHRGHSGRSRGPVNGRTACLKRTCG